MSVTITINKSILEEFPQLIYQLFYLSSKEQLEGMFYKYTAQGYYRELTDLLDDYQIPYRVYSSKDISLLTVLLIEKDKILALELKEQLEKWGFASASLSYQAYLSSSGSKNISLAILDKKTLLTLTLLEKIKLSIKLFPVPMLFLLTHVRIDKLSMFLVVRQSLNLIKPFSLPDLREAIERLLNIAILPFSKEKR